MKLTYLTLIFIIVSTSSISQQKVVLKLKSNVVEYNSDFKSNKKLEKLSNSFEIINDNSLSIDSLLSMIDRPENKFSYTRIRKKLWNDTIYESSFGKVLNFSTFKKIGIGIYTFTDSTERLALIFTSHPFLFCSSIYDCIP
jgi:hypothetical protein